MRLAGVGDLTALGRIGRGQRAGAIDELRRRAPPPDRDWRRSWARAARGQALEQGGVARGRLGVVVIEARAERDLGLLRGDEPQVEPSNRPLSRSGPMCSIGPALPGPSMPRVTSPDVTPKS